MKPKVSVIILSWNAEHLLRKFLPQATEYCTLRGKRDDVEIVIADNGSTDGTEEFVKELAAGLPSDYLQFLPLERNWGFAEGYNRALKEIEAEYVVLLNDDVEVTPDWLDPLVEYMDAHSDVAACQPKLLSWKEKEKFEYAGACGGYVDKYGYPFCRGRVFNTVETDYSQYSTTSALLWATGACLFIRKEEFQNAGGLDGRFFAHMEEIDLCWRLRCRMKSIACVTESTVFHVGGASLAAGNPRKTFLNFRNNLLMLYKNLPEEELRSVMRMRSLLDAAAAFAFLLKGEGKNFIAVFRARKAFRQLKTEFSQSREENLMAARKAGNPMMHVPERRPIFLLWHYHIKKKRTFSQL